MPRAHPPPPPAPVTPPAAAGLARGAPFTTSVAGTREDRIVASGRRGGRTTDAHTRICAYLRQAPRTTREIADALGLHLGLAGAWLAHMHRIGEACRVGMVCSNGRRATLWGLAE